MLAGDAASMTLGQTAKYFRSWARKISCRVLCHLLQGGSHAGCCVTYCVACWTAPALDGASAFLAFRFSFFLAALLLAAEEEPPASASKETVCSTTVDMPTAEVHDIEYATRHAQSGVTQQKPGLAEMHALCTQKLSGTFATFHRWADDECCKPAQRAHVTPAAGNARKVKVERG